MNKPREKAIYWLSDDHFKELGYNPASISDELFEDIRVEVANTISHSFGDYLAEAIEIHVTSAYPPVNLS